MKNATTAEGAGAWVAVEEVGATAGLVTRCPRVPVDGHVDYQHGDGMSSV